MSNEMMLARAFDYGGQRVRTVMIDGEVWFVARDVCAVLGLTNVAMALGGLDDDEKGVSTVDTPGGNQQLNIISEAGLYSLILRSRRPQAKAFKRWVTHDVLPEVRRTGAYAPAPRFEIPQTLGDALRLAADEHDARLAAEARVAELEPKADLADTFLIAEGGARLVREVAKLLRMREGELRRFLLDERLVFAKHAPCGDVQYDFRAGHAHHFVVNETVVNHDFGTCTHYTLRVLPRGIELIRKRLAAAAQPMLPEGHPART